MPPKNKADDLINPLIEDLKPFLKNIQKGIASFGIKDFNSKLGSMFTKEEGRDEVIKALFEIVYSEFEVTRHQIFSSCPKGKVKAAKYTTSAILFLEFNMPIRMIGRYVFKMKQFGFVWLAVKRHRNLNDKVKADREYKEKYDKVLTELKNKLTKK